MLLDHSCHPEGMGQKYNVVRSCPKAEVLRNQAPGHTEGPVQGGSESESLLKSSFQDDHQFCCLALWNLKSHLKGLFLGHLQLISHVYFGVNEVMPFV